MVHVNLPIERFLIENNVTNVLCVQWISKYIYLMVLHLVDCSCKWCCYCNGEEIAFNFGWWYFCKCRIFTNIMFNDRLYFSSLCNGRYKWMQIFSRWTPLLPGLWWVYRIVLWLFVCFIYVVIINKWRLSDGFLILFHFFFCASL